MSTARVLHENWPVLAFCDKACVSRDQMDLDISTLVVLVDLVCVACQCLLCFSKPGVVKARSMLQPRRSLSVNELLCMPTICAHSVRLRS
jgi:hypothetical protein